ncbi:Uncharacterised protein [Legionella steigerwaltii]|uniref:Uncharacterized protein n=1 Tax=Legionella steigerwaltii TaxID=460 RepID=A0A378L4I9_9GAMM|nr:hypothetical protein [Legionella steigerwaltii]KTD69962.1 hypothetical protein Lstg_3403 [Legionella steigerwaltii]STY21726.1 Uncharacterised protein [Legionella steigerwaltii]
MKFLKNHTEKDPSTQHSMITANLWKKNHQRLITVINNAPWYRSTGRNSGYAGTWFFFGGVLEKKDKRHARGWLIKPRGLVTEHYSKTQFFGRDTTHYIRKHSVHKLIHFSRFGDIKKICISASLDGGFWLTDKGKKLKKYLHKNYPEYFLSEELVKQIHETAMRNDLPVYTKRKQVNQWLSKQGVATVGVLHDESLLFRP